MPSDDAARPHAVLLIHGAGEDAHEEDAPLARSLEDALGPAYRVHYPQMPRSFEATFGDWTAPIRNALADLEGPVSLVGHSVGGSVLARFLCDERDALTEGGRAAADHDTGPHATGDHAAADDASGSHAAGDHAAGDRAAADDAAGTHAAGDDAAGSHAAGPHVAGLHILAAPFWGADDFWTWDEATLPSDAAARLTYVSKVFLYHATDDEVVPFAHQQLYATRLPDAQVRVLEAGGHQFGNDLTIVAQEVMQDRTRGVAGRGRGTGSSAGTGGGSR